MNNIENLLNDDYWKDVFEQHVYHRDDLGVVKDIFSILENSGIMKLLNDDQIWMIRYLRLQLEERLIEYNK